MALVKEFATAHSDRAFAILVERRIGLVHSAALRRVSQPQLAEEVTQAVFILLARKAASLKSDTVLPGWLYRTTGYLAADALKMQRRRAFREEQAFMQSTPDAPESPVWKDIAPLLESAMDHLGDHDRNALLLRFFEDKTLAEVGTALGVSEDAARVRINRALQKLQHYFARQGISSTTAMLAGTIAANSLQAVPLGLANTISAVAANSATLQTSTLPFLKGTLKIMAWTKIKIAIAAGAAVLLCAGTPLAIRFVRMNQAESSLFSLKTPLTEEQNAAFQSTTGTTPEAVAKTFFEALSREDWAEAKKFWPHKGKSPAKLPGPFKQRYGGMQIISVGKPFKGRLRIAALVELDPPLRKQFKSTEGDFEDPGVFIPYDVRLKDGSDRNWQLSIRCDNPEHRWYFDGGF